MRAHPPRSPMIPYRTATSAPIRKLQLQAAVFLLAALLPVVNWLLAKVGLSPISAGEAQALELIVRGLYANVVALAGWIVAYRARPAAQDTVVREAAPAARA